jgi:excinuclease ABC subunit C
VTIRAPVKGAGFKLMQLALKNAHDALTREKHRESVEGILERITARLGLPKLPQLIEGYDISNIAGADPVGVKVSFRDGRPEKSGYRKFKIRGYENQDDPGMIHQTVMRRVAHRDEDPLPDLFLIDGGKSQLNAAVAALRESLGDAMPPVASIAKMREERDEERFFIPNRKNEIVFPRGDPGLMLLMRVRDEAHRFAHGFQRKTHTEKVIRSSLDDIRGIGPRKREALLTMFGSVKNVIAASDEELVRAPGINAKDVEKIRAALGRPAAVPPAESETM